MATPPVLRCTARSRPIRAAFLVDPATLPADAFDALIETCMGAWGGGYWPIVPTDGSTIEEDYWRLLELTDPDFVTAAVDLSDGLRSEIGRRLAPARLDVRPVSPDDAHPLVRSDWSLSPVGSAGVLRHHSDQADLFGSDSPLIWFREKYKWTTPKNPWERPPPPTYPGRRFVQRNFGYPSVSWPLEHELKSLPSREVSLVDLSATEALAELTEGRGTYYRALCRRHAPRPFSPDHLGSPAYAVVVGDATSDAVRAWNRFVTSHPSGQTLWVPEDLVDDGAFMDALQAWAGRQWSSSSGAPTGILVESASVDTARLERLCTTLDTVQPVTVAAFSPGALPFSGRPGLSADGQYGGRDFELTTDVTSVVTADEATIAPVLPPVARPSTARGAWMVDLDIIDDTTPARYSNVLPRWRLPRRPDLARPFLHGEGFPRAYRIVRGGLPSVSVTTDAPSVGLRVPGQRQVAQALAAPRGEGDGEIIGYLRTSEQGRRFRTAVELFGGIYRAGETLCNEFWRNHLLRAAGSPLSSKKAQADTVIRLLAERGDLTDEQLALQIASKLHRRLKRSGDAIREKRLAGEFGKAVGKAYASEPRDQRPTFWKRGRPHLERLVQQGVLLQGLELPCPACGLTRWHPIDGLARTVRCPECLRPFPLPVGEEWAYQINGLVRSAITDDAVLPIIDAVYTIAKEARTHARVFPPADVFFYNDEAALTDLDLIVLRDGDLIVGEVKSSAAGFDRPQLSKLGAIGATIGAHEIVLAAPASTWTQGVEDASVQAVQDTSPSARVRALHLKPEPFW